MWREIERPTTPEPGVTDLIYCLTKAYYKRRHLEQVPARRTLMFFIVGLALEKALLGQSQQATSGVLDGIGFHTDHAVVDGDFVEVKSTRVSSKKDFDDLSKAWHRQLLAYFKTTDRKQGLMAILHLMGNYGPPFPDLVAYDIEATDKEINDNWDWLLSRRDILAEHEAKGEAPKEYTYRVVDWGGVDKDFECEDCPYKALCDMRNQGLL